MENNDFMSRIIEDDYSIEQIKNSIKGMSFELQAKLLIDFIDEYFSDDAESILNFSASLFATTLGRGIVRGNFEPETAKEMLESIIEDVEKGVEAYREELTSKRSK